MVLDPAAERERVYAKYAPMRRRDVVIWVIGLVVMFAVSRFVTVDWYGFAALVVGAVGWEITKLRLRRNADHYAGIQP